MTTPNADPFSVFLAVIATAFYHIDTKCECGRIPHSLDHIRDLEEATL